MAFFNVYQLMKSKQQKGCLLAAAACLAVICGIGYYYFFSGLSAKNETQYVYIDDDDNLDSVYTKMKAVANAHGYAAFKVLSKYGNYGQHIRTGRYAVKPGAGALATFRQMRNGQQAPVNLTIPSVRTIERLSAEIGKRLMMDSAALASALKDEKTCERYGYDTATISCMFIPNTYDIYWDTPVAKFLDKMNQENKRFWTEERKQKAATLHLSPNEVVTIASIIEEETANDEEKPMIAGMYYNRLTLRNDEYPQGMPLQADPTIKYALKRFDLKRIYHNMLFISSPYNTYKNPGLPPGPIRIPSIVSIDAVLNMVHHDYMYMCAKEDFSGTHNFARTYSEHLSNAARYSKALNERGIQ